MTPVVSCHDTPCERPPHSDQTTCPPQVHHLAAAVQPDRESGARLSGTAGRDALGLQRARDLQRWQHALTTAAGHGWADAPRPHAPAGEASGALTLPCTSVCCLWCTGWDPAVGIGCVSSTQLLVPVWIMALQLCSPDA